MRLAVSSLPGGWRRTLDVAAAALLARLLVVLLLPAEPVWDGYYYDLGARRLAAGLGYSEDLHLGTPTGEERVAWLAWAHYPIGYPGLLSLVYHVVGPGTLVGPIVNAITGALLAAVAHRLARALFEDERRATIAGLLVALHPGLVLYAGALMTEPLAALLMFGALLAARRGKNLASGPVLAGVLLGLATLVRPNVILLAPFVALLVHDGVLRRAGEAFARAGARWVARSAIVSACALAVVAPWTVRNCRVMDACAFVSTNAGWNLVIGSAPGATGKFEFLVGHTPEGGPSCDEGGQVAQDRCWFRYGTRIIKAHPGHWLSLVPAKLHYTLDAEWFPINYLREARPDAVSAGAHIVIGKLLTGFNHLLVTLAALAALGGVDRGEDRRARRVQLALLVGLAILLGLSADLATPRVWPLGVAACLLPLLPRVPGAPRRDPTEWAIAGVILTTLLTHALFFGEDRYHLVASPAFALLAAGLARRGVPVART
ncbi:MAG: glycosyltransferase family 39 protein [Myxococcales bacterium]|nr:glycosyltransferase family 39 protein [Myxococcales bacterium]